MFPRLQNLTWSLANKTFGKESPGDQQLGKEGKRREEWVNWTCTQGVEELKAGSRSPLWGDRLEPRGRLLESRGADLWQSEWSESHIDDLCRSPTYPGQVCTSTGTCSSRALEHRDWRAIPGWGLLLTVGRWQGIPLEESWAANGCRCYCWVTRRVEPSL